MSLLMDALKKAEEEKKRAANQNKVSAEDIADSSGQHDTESDLSSTGQVEQQASKTDKLELTLAPLEKSADDLPIDDDELTQEISATDAVLDLTAEEKKDNDKTLVDDYSFSEDLTAEHTIADEINDSDLEETKEADDLDSTAILQDLTLDETSAAPFDDTFHGVVLDDEESAYEETLPGVSADQLIKDLGGSVYQSTPVAAQTVIAAGKKKPKSSSFKWGIFSVLLLLAFSSFGVIYYFSITPVARTMPSPVVARGIEATPTAMPAMPTVENENVSATLIEQQSIATEQVAESMKNKVSEFLAESEPEVETVISEIEAVSTELNQSEAFDSTESTLAEENVDIEAPVISSEIDSENTTTMESVAEPVQKEIVQVDEMPKQESIKSLPEYLKLDQKAVSITKNEQFEKQSLLVNQAYNAYQQGNLKLAQSMYQDALRLQKDNRDALLGLATIEARQNNSQEAFEYYKAVLSLNPDDAIALTGIQSLFKNRDPVQDESAIKILLQKEGEQAYLYFALGNSFAKQQRWPDAQQAFFDALRMDSNNAQYAMNLAISLDHLSQHATALEYYRRALSLSSSANEFDVVTVQQRINVLASQVSK